MKTRTGHDGSGRYYIVDEKTKLALPSVTTIIRETSDKSGLVEWQNRVGEAEAARVSKFSANRGTFMHSLHEHYLQCRYIEGLGKPLQESMKRALTENSTLTKEEIDCGKNLFLQFQQSPFYDDIGEIIFQEAPVWSTIGGGYAGRLDLSIRTKSGIPKIIGGLNV